MNLKYIQYEENRKIFYFFNTETYDVIEIKSKEDVRLPGYATKQIPGIIDYLNEKMPFDFKVSFTNLTTSNLKTEFRFLRRWSRRVNLNLVRIAL